MLKFAKSVPYLPDPARSRPLVTEEHKQQAAETPPHPVPFHCKPWVDGQTLGWTLFYGYLTGVTIIGRANGRIHVENSEQLARETNQPRIIDQFAPGHFGIGSGYTLYTPPGHSSLLLPATHAPDHLQALTGLIETDWYPRQIFIVFPTPPPEVAISLAYKTELARVVVVARQAQMEAHPLDEAELAALKEREAAYLEEERTTDSKWTAATGDSFTHLYKQWSSRYRTRD